MSLSAYLAQATGAAKYTQAAYAAGGWIARANTNAAGLPLDTINGRTCARSDASWVFTYNAGKYVEGLTALYGATRNSSLLAECVSPCCARAGTETDGWHQGDERRGGGRARRAVAARGRRDHGGRAP
jgi:predicted alpha-1,6-mannanase (GH76 family)